MVGVLISFWGLGVGRIGGKKEGIMDKRLLNEGMVVWCRLEDSIRKGIIDEFKKGSRIDVLDDMGEWKSIREPSWNLGRVYRVNSGTIDHDIFKHGKEYPLYAFRCPGGGLYDIYQATIMEGFCGYVYGVECHTSLKFKLNSDGYWILEVPDGVRFRK